MTRFYANRDSFRHIDNLDIDQNVRSKLTINLVNIWNGNQDVYLTPVAKEHSPELILSEWSKIFQGNRDLMNSPLIDLEEAQQSKTGPRSVSKPWSQRLEQVDAYFEDKHIDYSWLQVLQPAIRHYGVLRPISVSNAIKLLKNDTNSGLPLYTRKGQVKDRVLARFSEFLKRQDPCVLFTRTQEGGKTRDVWGFPMADTLNEMMFYKPLLDFQRQLSWRSSINGPTSVDRKMTHIIQRAKSLGLTLISIDFSNYDRSLKPGLLEYSTKYYKLLFQSQYHDDLDYIAHRKSNIGLVTPSKIIEGPHAMPSGSTFTNEDDSVIQYTVANSSGVLLGDLFDVQGDDGVYAVKPDQVNSLFAAFRRAGLDVNEDKSYKSADYLIYLQNLYHADYSVNGVIKGIYPTFRALNRILYQERWSNFEDYGMLGKDYYTIRTISILENCKNHPLFEKLVRFILKYDKYSLRYSKGSISQYVKMLSSSSGTEGVINNQYGDDVSGLNSFETVKLIRKLRS